MPAPAAPIPSRSLELSLLEARTRFVQLIRLAGLTRQATTITDTGRPIAAIVPIEVLRAIEVQARDDSLRPSEATAGWMRRIEQVRDDVRRQHADRIRNLEQALEQAWQAIDSLRGPGSDADIDALRVLHADTRRSP